jgi:serine/threonine protein kinase
LAVVERRRFGLLTDSFVITEYLEHALDLDTLLTLRLRETAPAVQRHVKDAIIQELAVVLRRLHERGFTHRDLKAPNVMIQWNPQDEAPPRVLLVDLDGLKRVRKPSAEKQIRALTRLNISLDHCARATLTDRVRFLKCYLRRVGNPDSDWKALWHEVAARSERKRKSRRRQQQKMLAKYGRF